MLIKIEAFEALCELRHFVINDTEADYNDFGVKEDIAAHAANPYGCGNMTFESKKPEQNILDKYDISEEEYALICTELTEKLSFGECGWCV